MVEDSRDEIDISDQAQRARLSTLKAAYASSGSWAEQSRFVSSPKSRTEQSHMARSGKQMVELAMTIMNECELDMPADAREKLN